ncbi:MAG TPA: ABC transporter ATP-binding protein [Deltaproteobacteria bacterium]|nr:ABC transporter ATP-binding protein [Deltaproteobacteria bacterium]HDP24923.1 ABC transporter ATP-binding protein [Deltaproteobacteria bacterium]
MRERQFFSVQNLSIRFGGIQALKDVSLEVKPGSIHALIGPNGAGKTTILNCISRVYKADGGTVVFKGEDVSRLKPHQVVSRGISRTFQNIELFSNMTVMDNILLGRHSKRQTSLLNDALFWGKSQRQEMQFRERVEEIIDFLDLQAYRNLPISRIPYGVQKNVELARALAAEPDLLLLDEPSSGLNVEETQDLAFWIEDIKEDFGITILLVEHDMRLVMDVCDAATAFNYGSVLAYGTPADVVKDPEVVKAYLGEEG